MQIIIEAIENGFICILQDQKNGRKVFAAAKGSDVVDFVKNLLDPSPIQVPNQELTVVKP